MSDSHYLLHGIHLAGPFTLMAPAAPADAEPDLRVVSLGHRVIDEDHPSGLLLTRSLPNEQGSTLAQQGDTFTLRYAGFAEFIWQRGEARCWLKPDLHADWMAALVGSSLMANFALSQGRVPYHAGVMAVEGRAMALLGYSGAGKTTLSVAACLQGAQMVSDDVLLLDWRDGVPFVTRGSQESRMRPEAYASLIPDGQVQARETVDGRKAVRFTPAEADCPLARLCFLHIDEHTKGLQLEPLSGITAVQELMRNLRTATLVHAPLHAALLAEVSQLSRLGLLYRLRIERGLHQNPALGTMLMALLGK